MTARYRESIEAYCRQSGIDIPSGFYRHNASRYVAIDLDTTPHKLIARTWFDLRDVAYYLTHLAAGKSLRVLDFKERNELHFLAESEFSRGDSF
jgi:hypothetical protein